MRRRGGLVQLRQRGQRLVAELTWQALARQQREVHRPVPDVIVFALDAAELVVGETAELVFNRAKRLIEQDARRILNEAQGSGPKAEGRRQKARAEYGTSA